VARANISAQTESGCQNCPRAMPLSLLLLLMMMMMMMMMMFFVCTELLTGAVRCSGQCLVPGNQPCNMLNEAMGGTMELLTAVILRSEFRVQLVDCSSSVCDSLYADTWRRGAALQPPVTPTLHCTVACHQSATSADVHISLCNNTTEPRYQFTPDLITNLKSTTVARSVR